MNKYLIVYLDDYARTERMAIIDDPKNHPYTSLEYYTVRAIYKLGEKIV